MTAHELARALLAGPDVPVVMEYGEGGPPEEVRSVDDASDDVYRNAAEPISRVVRGDTRRLR